MAFLSITFWIENHFRRLHEQMPPKEGYANMHIQALLRRAKAINEKEIISTQYYYQNIYKCMLEISLHRRVAYSARNLAQYIYNLLVYKDLITILQLLDQCTLGIIKPCYYCLYAESRGNSVIRKCLTDIQQDGETLPQPTINAKRQNKTKKNKH